MQVPGWLWTLLIALIPPVIDWLQTGELSGSPWVPAAIIVLGAVAKLVELAVTLPQPTRAYSPKRPASYARRFLLGG